MVDVLHYRAGNAQSVINALCKIGAHCRLISTRKEIEGSESIVLPGVGAAKATMSSLKESGCLELLRLKVMDEKVPFLGICIGLQVLFDHSEEEDTQCLGWIPGKVRRFPDSEVSVPQIGWNEVNFTREHPLLSGLASTEYFYFVNSYYAVPEDKSIVLGITDYWTNFCSMLIWRNICATQFHVEKSGDVGLRLLRNFVDLSEDRHAYQTTDCLL